MQAVKQINGVITTVTVPDDDRHAAVKTQLKPLWQDVESTWDSNSLPSDVKVDLRKFMRKFVEIVTSKDLQA